MRKSENAGPSCWLTCGRGRRQFRLKIRGLRFAWLVVIVGWAFTSAAQGQGQPGYDLVYSAAGLNGSEDHSVPPDGNLSNPDEWFEPVTGTPYESVPQSGDDASVDNSGLSLVYGALDCWGAGLEANAVPLAVDASLNIGVGGLALSGDPYGPSALTLDTAASTSGGFVTLGNTNLDASVTGGAWWLAAGNTGANAGVSCNGLLVTGTLNVNSGSAVTTGQLGTFPPSTSETDFYSTTTALQVDDGGSANINGGSVICNGDAILGADGDNTGPGGTVAFATLAISSGKLTTSGVTYMGVSNPNEQGSTSFEPGYGLVIDDGTGSSWQANGDIRVGDSNGGNGSIYVQDGANLTLGPGVNLRIGSSVGGGGSVTFDGTSGNPTLTSDSTTSILVGDQGIGTLAVQNGASISHGGTIVVGNGDGSSGNLVVQGDNSSLTSAGDTTVGDNGTGTVSIISSGAVNESGNMVLGSQTAGNGTVNVGQTASTSNSASSGTLNVSQTLTVGEAGTGDLEVDGGTVAVSGPASANVVLGDASTGVGTVNVNGATSILSAGGMIIGNNGQGTLTVNNGTLAVTGDLTIAAQDGSSGSLTVTGENAVLDIGGNLNVGANGAATLLISDATVNLGVGGGSQPTLSGGIESASTLTVPTIDDFDNLPNGLITGATFNANSAFWTLGKNTSNNMLTVSGRSMINGLGAIEISGGPPNSPSNGNTLLISGNGTSFESDRFLIGETGTAFMDVTSGATALVGGGSESLLLIGASVGTGNVVVSNNGTIKSAPGTSNATISLGFDSPGAMVISTNGVVNVNKVVIGGSAGGSVTVSGTGTAQSATLTTGSLYVGSGAPGQLLVDAGGVATGNVVVFGNLGGSAGTGDVSGMGSALNGTTLSVGNVGSGDLTIESAASATFTATDVGGASGTMLTVTGQGSYLSTGSLSVASNQNTGEVDVDSGGSVNIATLLENFKGGTIDLSGGGSMTVGGTQATHIFAQLTVNANATVQNYGTIIGNAVINPGATWIQLGQFDGLVSGPVGASNLSLMAGADELADSDPIINPTSVTGDYTLDSGAVLDMQIAGSADGDYGHLSVGGTTSLLGTVLLDFQDGFAPSAGDVYDLFTFTGGVNSFANQIQVSGLEPGWEYALAMQNGDEVIESLNNGVAVPEPSALFSALGICGVLSLRRPRLPTFPRHAGKTPSVHAPGQSTFRRQRRCVRCREV